MKRTTQSFLRPWKWHRTEPDLNHRAKRSRLQLEELETRVLLTNNAPIAVADAYTVAQDGVLSVPAAGVLDNDSDADDDTLSAVIVVGAEPGYGDLTLNGDGSFVYTPYPGWGYIGQDSFSYQAFDGIDLSDPVTVTIDITQSPYELYQQTVEQATQALSDALYNAFITYETAYYGAVSTAESDADQAYQTYLSTAQSAYYDYVSAESTAREAHESSAGQAEADANAAIDAAHAAYNDALSTAQDTFTSAMSAADAEYENSLSAADTAYDDAVAPLETARDQAWDAWQADTEDEQLQADYEAAEQAFADGVDQAVADREAAYSAALGVLETAQTQATQERDDSIATADAEYAVALAAADALRVEPSWDAYFAAETAARQTYLSAEAAAWNLYVAAFESIEDTLTQAVTAAELDYGAAVAAAQSAWDAVEVDAWDDYITALGGATPQTRVTDPAVQVPPVYSIPSLTMQQREPGHGSQEPPPENWEEPTWEEGPIDLELEFDEDAFPELEIPDLSTAPADPEELEDELAEASAINLETTPEINGDPPPPPGTPTTVIQSGGYTRHYRHTGQGGNVSFYLDVSIISTFSTTTGEGGVIIPSESGTITYNAWKQTNGQYDFQYDNVVTNFNYDLGTTGTLSFYGQPNSPNPVPGFGYTDFYMALPGPGTTHWEEQFTFNATGTTSGADGVSRSFVVHSEGNYAEDRTNTWQPSSSGGPLAGTSTYTVNITGNGKTFKQVSDQSSNFATQTEYGTDGLPTSLLTAPATGSTYLQRSFDTYAFNSNSTSTTVTLDGGYFGSSSTVANGSYNGSDGELLYFERSESTGATNGSTSTHNHVTVNVDYQRTGTYSGEWTQNLASDVPMSQAGTTVRTHTANGTVHSDKLKIIDVYFRDDGALRAKGTATFERTNLGAATYSNTTTTTQTRSNIGQFTTDAIDYVFENEAASKTTTSDNAAYTLRERDAQGVIVGQAAGVWVNTGSTTTSGGSTLSGAVDRVTGAAYLYSDVHSSGSTSSSSFFTSNYAASNGSLTRNLKTSESASGTFNNTSYADGNFNTAGTQISGTSTDTVASSSSSTGTFWMKTTPQNAPVHTIQTNSESGGTFNLTTNFTHSAAGNAGSANSSVTQNSSEDTLVTLIGTLTTSVGTAGFDDKSDTKSTHSVSATSTLTYNGSQPSGTVTTDVDQRQNYNIQQARTLDRTDNTLHSTSGSQSTGMTHSHETFTDVHSAGQVVSSRTQRLEQKGNSKSTSNANGQLADDKGHTGSWNMQTRQDSLVDDTVTVNYSWANNRWNEGSREFHVKREGTSRMTFHEDDNGLGIIDDFMTGSHRLDVTIESSYTRRADGSPTAYTFVSNNADFQRREEAFTSQWNNPATGESGNSGGETEDRRSYRNNRAGNVAGTQTTYSAIDFRQHDYNRRSYDRTATTPTGQTESHQRSVRDETTTLLGSTAQGTGTHTGTASSAMWGTTATVNGAPTNWGNQNPTVTPLGRPAWSWPGQPTSQALSALMVQYNWMTLGMVPPLAQRATAAIQTFGLGNTWVGSVNTWINANGGNVLRTIGGAIDVTLGVVMALGTGGLAWAPAVGLMTLGVDQIVTGVNNIATGVQGPSVIEFGVTRALVAIGANEQGAELIGALAPAALSMVLGFSGSRLGALTMANRLRGTSNGASTATRVANFFGPDVIQTIDDFDLFYSVPNAAGGRVWVSNGLIDQIDVAIVARSQQGSLRTIILSGAHGEPTGLLRLQRRFFLSDLDYAWRVPVEVLDVGAHTPQQLRALVNSRAIVIAGWCHSDRTVDLLRALGLAF